jgi:putative sterol carrier protein
MIPEAKAIQIYVTEFFPSVIGKSIFADIDNLTLRFGFYITNMQQSYSLLIEKGCLKSIETYRTDDTETLFELDARTLLEIAAGELPPQEAFFTGRIEILGDTLKGLKLVPIFQKFIQQHPFIVSGT